MYLCTKRGVKMENFFDEAFAKQDQLMKEAEEAKKNAGNINFEDYEEVKWLGLPPNKSIAFRLVGLPFLAREVMKDRGLEIDPTITKLVLHSRIMKDDEEGYINVNWPYIIKNGKYIPDPNWILTELLDTVENKYWYSYTEADIDNNKIKKDSGGKIKNLRGYEGEYRSNSKGKPSYERIVSNLSKNQDPSFKPRFRPSNRVICQVISRMDNWCKENKHTMLLATSVGQKDYKQDDGSMKTIYFPSVGISLPLYEKIKRYFRKFRKDWDIDFIIERYKSNNKWEDDISSSAQMDMLSEEIKHLVNNQPLTEEEKNYEKYNLDKLKIIGRTTSYSKLRRNIIGLFEQTDLDFKTNFTERLNKLADEEKEIMKKLNESKNNSVFDIESNENIEDFKEEKVQEKTVEVKSEENSQQESEVKLSVNNENLEKVFEHWDKLDFLCKNDILESGTYIDTENKEIFFKAGISLVPCDNKECSLLLPDKVASCPKCGTVF